MLMVLQGTIPRSSEAARYLHHQGKAEQEQSTQEGRDQLIKVCC